jgi:hypothetical protein
MRDYRQGSSSEEDLYDDDVEAMPGKQSLSAAVDYGDDKKDYDKPSGDTKDNSARFGGDKHLEGVAKGKKVVEAGDKGVEVTKVQQALIDLGYLLPVYGVDAKFGKETKAAVKKFQKEHPPLKETGKLDKATLAALNTIYDTRKPYIDNAAVDPADPGKKTRTLSADDKKAALEAMVPKAGVGGAPSKFDKKKKVGGKLYDEAIKIALKALIKGFHKELFEDKEPLRADPGKNFHDWSVMEGPAKASKQVVDKLYDSNYGGAAAFPAMTNLGGNLIDQWEDEIAINKGLTDPQKKDKAQDKVRYLIDSNCDDVNLKYAAVPSDTEEEKMLGPVIDDLTASPKQIQDLLDLDIGWEGAQLDGKVYLQRYKSQDKDPKAAKEANRVQMWGLFQTCIHEYIHTLAHKDFNTWARTFRAGGDNTRYNTLTEGFCDFFTLNVRKDMTIGPGIIKDVEGPYANGNPPAPDTSGVYPSHQQAEQVVSIIGIQNAQRGYFGGKTDLMGGP